MIPISFDSVDGWETVNVAGKPYLFTNLRVDRSTLPKDLYAYDVRDSGSDGCFREVKQFVFVNHWGCIVGYDRIEEAENSDGYTCHEPDGCFLDAYSVEEYRECYRELLDECKELVEVTEQELAARRAMADKELLGVFFGIFDDNKEVDYAADGIMRLIEDSLTADELTRRFATNAEREAYGAYISAADDYLCERDAISDGAEEDEGQLEPLLKAVKQTEEELKQIFTSVGREYSFVSLEDFAAYVVGLSPEEYKEALPENIRGLGLTDEDIPRWFPDKETIEPGKWSDTCFDQGDIQIGLYREPEEKWEYGWYGPYTIQIFNGDDVIAYISAR